MPDVEKIDPPVTARPPAFGAIAPDGVDALLRAGLADTSYVYRGAFVMPGAMSRATRCAYGLLDGDVPHAFERPVRGRIVAAGAPFWPARPSALGERVSVPARRGDVGCQSDAARRVRGDAQAPVKTDITSSSRIDRASRANRPSQRFTHYMTHLFEVDGVRVRVVLVGGRRFVGAA